MLRTLSDLAAPFEVRLALECGTHAEGPVASLAHCQQIIHRVARPNVGLSLNICALCPNEETLGQIDALDVDKLWLVRLPGAKDVPSEARPAPEGTRTADGAFFLREPCLRLSARGFVGPYSVPVPPSEGPLTEAARTARLATLRLAQRSPHGGDQET